MKHQLTANKRFHAYYSGFVQGVGFRFTAERLAISLDINGWVKNLGDGRVELVCEGTEASLKGLLAKLEEAFGEYIHKTDIEWENATGEFESFDIRF